MTDPAVLASSCPWDLWSKSAMRACEAPVCAWVVEPANTWSNLPYIFVGLLILFKKPARGYPVWSRYFGFIITAIGVSSFLFHASGTTFFHFFDVATMQLLGLYLVLDGLMATRKIKFFRQHFIGILAFLFAAGCILMLLFGDRIGIFIFAACLIPVVSLELSSKHPRSRHWLIIAVLVFACSACLLILDKSTFWCQRNNHWIQAHAAWHVLNAVALYFLAKAKVGVGLSNTGIAHSRGPL